MAKLPWNPMSFMGNTNQPGQKPAPPAQPQAPGLLREKSPRFLEGMFDNKNSNPSVKKNSSVTPTDPGTKVGVW